MATAGSVDLGCKGLHSAHARRNRCYIGPVHATFAGNVDFGGAGLHTALARGEAVRTRGRKIERFCGVAEGPEVLFTLARPAE